MLIQPNALTQANLNQNANQVLPEVGELGDIRQANNGDGAASGALNNSSIPSFYQLLVTLEIPPGETQDVVSHNQSEERELTGLQTIQPLSTEHDVQAIPPVAIQGAEVSTGASETVYGIELENDVNSPGLMAHSLLPVVDPGPLAFSPRQAGASPTSRPGNGASNIKGSELPEAGKDALARARQPVVEPIPLTAVPGHEAIPFIEATGTASERPNLIDPGPPLPALDDQASGQVHYDKAAPVARFSAAVAVEPYARAVESPQVFLATQSPLESPPGNSFSQLAPPITSSELPARQENYFSPTLSLPPTSSLSPGSPPGGFETMKVLGNELNHVRVIVQSDNLGSVNIQLAQAEQQLLVQFEASPVTTEWLSLHSDWLRLAILDGLHQLPTATGEEQTLSKDTLHLTFTSSGDSNGDSNGEKQSWGEASHGNAKHSRESTANLATASDSPGWFPPGTTPTSAFTFVPGISHVDIRV